MAIETPSNLTHYIGLEAMCLIWRWKISGEGYGLISIPKRRVKVHRLAYALSRVVDIEKLQATSCICAIAPIVSNLVISMKVRRRKTVGTEPITNASSRKVGGLS